MGYFRNDTSGHKVYFSTQPGINEIVLYDFNTSAGTVYSSTLTSQGIYTVSIGGIQRTKWSLDFLDPFGSQARSMIIEGIGSTIGLFSSPDGCHQQYGSYEICPPLLESFCVCGQTLYPDTATGQCTLLSSIKDNVADISAIHLSPTPAIDKVHLSYQDADKGDNSFLITDLTGREIYATAIREKETDIPITALARGAYIWHLLSATETIRAGKLLKQ